MKLHGMGGRTVNTWRYISGAVKGPLVGIAKALGTVEKVLEVPAV